MRAVCLYTDSADIVRDVQEVPNTRGPPGGGELPRRGPVARRHRRPPPRPPQHPGRRAAHGAGRCCRSGGSPELLDLPWAQPGRSRTVPRQVRAGGLPPFGPDGPRINAIASVATADDVRRAVATGDFARFVLKPNDGFGNATIGYFDADGEPAELDRYLAELEGTALLIRRSTSAARSTSSTAGSTPTALPSASRCGPTGVAALNGRKAVSTGDISVPTAPPTSPRSSTTPPTSCGPPALSAAPSTSGSRWTTPVHADRGGFRLAGGELADIDPLLHGSLDPIALALHYYPRGDRAPRQPVDFVALRRPPAGERRSRCVDDVGAGVRDRRRPRRRGPPGLRDLGPGPEDRRPAESDDRPAGPPWRAVVRMPIPDQLGESRRGCSPDAAPQRELHRPASGGATRPRLRAARAVAARADEAPADLWSPLP